ncbi:hypothetical protein DRQ26_07100 [bacterium]|nr:MAG: hypothetical protein DRQ26_07100 [bacterium]
MQKIGRITFIIVGKVYLISIIFSGCVTMGQRAANPVNNFHYTMPIGAKEVPPDVVSTKDNPPEKPREDKTEFSNSFLSSSRDVENANREGWGYKIQIYISLQQEDAQNVAETAQNKLDEKVTVEFDPPYYKVRIGNCVTSEEAEELLEKVKRIGYPDAWIVRAKIISVKEK